MENEHQKILNLHSLVKVDLEESQENSENQ